MAADYHQLEFDLRSYLSYLDAGGEALWSGNGDAGERSDPPPGHA